MNKLVFRKGSADEYYFRVSCIGNVVLVAFRLRDCFALDFLTQMYTPIPMPKSKTAPPTLQPIMMPKVLLFAKKKTEAYILSSNICELASLCCGFERCCRGRHSGCCL